MYSPQGKKLIFLFFFKDSFNDCCFGLFPDFTEAVGEFLLWFDLLLKNSVFLRDNISFDTSNIFPRNLLHTSCLVKMFILRNNSWKRELEKKFCS